MAAEKVVTWDDLQVGQDLGTESFPYKVTQEQVKAWIDCVGDCHPLYLDEKAAKGAGWPGVIVPPGMAYIFLSGPGRQAAARPPGGIHAKQSLEFYQPVQAGDVLTVSSKIVEKYLKNERKYVVTEMTAVNRRGQKVMVGRATTIMAR